MNTPDNILNRLRFISLRILITLVILLQGVILKGQEKYKITYGWNSTNFYGWKYIMNLEDKTNNKKFEKVFTGGADSKIIFEHIVKKIPTLISGRISVDPRGAQSEKYQSFDHIYKPEVKDGFFYFKGNTNINSGSCGGYDLRNTYIPGNLTLKSIQPYYNIAAYAKGAIACGSNSIKVELSNSSIYCGKVTLEFKKRTSSWGLSGSITKNVSSKYVYISYQDVRNYVDRNEEFQIRVVRPDGSKSEPQSNYVFLPPPNINVSVTPPACNNGSAQINITGLNPIEGDKMFFKWGTLTTKETLNGSFPHPNIPYSYLFIDQQEKETEVKVGETSKTLSKPITKSSYYFFSVRYDGMVCSDNEVKWINNPTAVNFNSINVNNVITKNSSGLPNDNYQTSLSTPKGSATVDVSGGSGSYQYELNGNGSWINLPSNKIITDLSGSTVGTTYNVKIRDTNGCEGTTTKNVTIKSPSQLILNVKQPASYVCGSSTTSMKYKVEGGAGPFKATLTKNGIASSNYSNITINSRGEYIISNLGVGSYVLTVTDDHPAQKNSASGISVNHSFSIDQRTVPTANFITEPTSYCNSNGKDGKIIISNTSPTYASSEYYFKSSNATNYTKSAYNPHNTQTKISGLSAGTYQVYVRGYGCNSSVETVTVNKRSNPVITIINNSLKDQVCERKGSVDIYVNECHYGEDISLQVKENGGSVVKTKSVKPYRNGKIRYEFDYVIPGSEQGKNYQILFSNGARGCSSSSSSFSVGKVNGLSNINYEILRDESCSGKSNAAVRLNRRPQGEYTITGLKGGSYDKDYNIASGLKAGDYEFTITELEGRKCVRTISVKGIKVSDDKLTASVSNNNSASCEGSASGSIQLNASGGISSDGSTNTSQYRYYLNGVLKSTKSSSSNKFTGLSNNSYTLKVIDDVGCEVSKVVNIGFNPNGPITIGNPSNLKDQYCNEGQKGSFSIKATTSNSVNSLKYQISGVSQLHDNKTNSSNPVSFINLDAGNYTVTVTDKEANCSSTSQVQIKNKNYSPNVKVDYTNDLACESANNGNVKISVTDYTASGDNNQGFLFSFKDENNLETSPSDNSSLQKKYSNLNNQNYKLQVTDAFGCKYIKNDVKVPINTNAVTLQINSFTQTSCPLATNGTITVSASQGVPNTSGNYTIYLYEGLKTTPSQILTGSKVTFSGLKVSEYKIKVIDEEGCSYTSTPIGITSRVNTLSITNPLVDKTTCYGGSDGSIAVTIGNDNYPGGTYTYKIYKKNGSKYSEYAGASFNRSTGKFSGLSAGIYEINVKEQGQNCFASYSNIEVAEPLPIQFFDSSISCISKHNGSDGAFSIFISEGNKEYTYEWYKDGENPETGTISYSNPETAYNFKRSGLKAGKYIFKLKDIKGCNYFNGSDTYVKEVVITQPSAPLSLSAKVTNERCYNSKDGRVVLNATGGWLCAEHVHSEDCNNVAHYNCPDWQEGAGKKCKESPYLFAIGSGGWSCKYDYQQLDPGNYTFRVKDKAGNVESISITIKSRPSMSLSINSVTDATCPGYADGKVNATVNIDDLGKDDIDYIIRSTNAGSTFADVTLNGNKFFNYNLLPEGNYQLNISDVNGCKTSATFVINEPAPAEISYTHNYIKDKGDATGELSVSTSKGNGVFDYKVLFDGNVIYNETENTSGSISMSNRLAGVYTVQVRDTAGCAYESGEWMERTIEIKEPAETFTFGKQELSNVTCKSFRNGFVNAEATGGWGNEYKYSLNGKPEQTNGFYDNLVPGSYALTIADTSGVSRIWNFEITEPDSLTIKVDKTFDATCPLYSNGRIETTVENGIDFYNGLQFSIRDLYNPSNYHGDFRSFKKDYRYSKLPKGEYEITVRDSNSCEDTDVFSIGEPAPAEISYTHNYIKDKGDATGELLVSTTKGNGVFDYKVLLDGNVIYNETENTSGSISMSNRLAGVYTVQVRDTAGCAYESGEWMERTIEIKEPAETFTFGKQELSNVTCKSFGNGFVKAEATGGWGNEYKYSLNGKQEQTNGFYDNLVPGSYALTIADTSGVSRIWNFEITEPDSLTIKVDKTFDATCPQYSNGRIETTVENGINFYNGLQFSIRDLNTPPNYHGDFRSFKKDYRYSKLPKGEYEITVRDSNSCEDTDVFSIGEPAPAEISYTHNYIKDKGDATGELLVSTTKGNGVFDYKVLLDGNVIYNETENTSGSISMSNLLAGVYTVQVRDTAGCAYESGEWMERTIEIKEPAETFTFGKQELSNVTCKSFGNGFVKAEATGGWGNEYKYSLNGKQEQTNGFYDNLVPGTYALTIADTSGVSRIWNFEITEPDSLTIKVDKTFDATCPQYSNGRIETTVENGIDFYNGLQFSIRDLNTPSNYHGDFRSFKKDYRYSKLPKGEYEITVRDSNSCEDTDVFSIGEPAPAEISYTHNYIKDKGDATGELSVSTTKGNGVFDYKVLFDGNVIYNETENTSGSISMNNRLAGLYTIQVRDIGCVEWMERAIEIKEPKQTFMFGKQELSNVTCKSFGNGFVDAIATGGWGNEYEYSLNGKQEQANGFYDNLVPGTYALTIADTSGVSRIWNFEITEPDSLTIKVDKTFDATCPQYANGRIETTVENGINFYNGLQFSIRDLNTPSNYHGDFKSFKKDYRYGKLPKGEYEITVRDSNACMDTDLFSIGEPDTVKINIKHNYIKAKGNLSGFISIDIDNGNQWFDYKWFYNDGALAFDQGQIANTLDLKFIPAGEYKLMVRDTAGCVYESSDWMERTIQIKEPDKALRFNILQNQPVSCFELSDGLIEVVPEGGWGDYTLINNLGKPQNHGKFNNLVAGEYKISITDSAGISWDSTLIIVQPDLLKANYESHKNINCYNGNDGEINLEVNGGNGNYQISIDEINWIEGTSIQKLPIGKYNLHVKDAKGCAVAVENIVLTQPEEIVKISENIIKSRCLNNEGSIEAEFTGGIGQFSFDWFKISDDNTIETPMVGETASNIYNLYSSRYKVLVTDEHLCTIPFEFVVGDITDLGIDTIIVTPVSCFGYSDGNAKAEVIKGNKPYFYSWPSSVTNYYNDSVWGVSSGEYELLVRDNKGCRTSQKFNIETPDPLLFDTINFSDPLCYGGIQGVMEVQAQGGTPGYIYEWSNGVNTNLVSDVEPGIYSLKLKDSHQCEANFDVEFDYQRVLTPFIGNDTLICQYDSLIIDPGTYHTYNLVSESGYSSTSSKPVIKDPSIYYLEVTDADHCLGYDTLKLDVSYLNISDFKQKDVTCNKYADGLAEINVSPAGWDHIIRWPDGSGKTSWHNLSGGDYNVQVTDKYGCVDNRKFSIFEPDVLNYQINLFEHTLCYGNFNGVIEGEVQGGVQPYNVLWSNGSSEESIHQLDTGNYRIDITDANNCSYQKEFDLDYQRKLTPFIGNDTLICHYDSLIIDPGTYHTYNLVSESGYSSTSSKPVIKDPSIYYLEVTDADHCLGYDTLKLDVSYLNISDFKQKDVTCNKYADGLAEINVSPAGWDHIIRWPDGSGKTSWHNLSGGDYNVQVTDKYGCVDNRKFSIFEPDVLNYQINLFEHTLCYGNFNGVIEGEVQGGVQPYNVLWSNGSSEESIHQLDTGNYRIDITDANNCSYQKEFDLDYQRKLTPFIGNDTLICQYDSLIIDPGTYHTYNLVSESGYSSTSSKPVIKDPSIYYLEVTDADHCLGYDTLKLDVSYLNISDFKQKDVTCNKYADGLAEINVSPAGWDHIIRWPDGSGKTSWHNLSGGDYNVQVTDKYGCVDNRKFSIFEPDVLNYQINLFEHTLCYGNFNGVIEGEVQGGVQPYNVLWSNGSSEESIHQLDTGNYRIDITDANNCSYQKEFDLDYQRKLTPFIGNDTLICHYDSLIIDPGTYHTYNLVSESGYSSTSSKPVIKDPSIYYLKVTDADHCLGYDTLKLDVSYLNISDFKQKDVTCNKYADGLAEINVSPAGWDHIIRWPDGSGKTSWHNLSGGDYNVQVTDKYGCVDNRKFSIFEPDVLNYQITDILDPLCLGNFNGYIHGEVKGGVLPYSVNWNNGMRNQNINDLDTGYYRIDVTDANNCFYQKEFNFSYRKNLKPYVGKDTLICHYNTLPLDAGDYKKFAWTASNGFSSSKRNIAVEDPGTYYLRVTDKDKCLGFDTINIDVSYLKISDFNYQDVTCNGDADGWAKVTVSPKDWVHNIEWTDGSDNKNWTGLSGGNYDVRVYDTYGCEDNHLFTIYEPDAMALTVNKLMNPLCFGVPNGIIKVSASGGRPKYSYVWKHGENKHKVNNLDIGSYHLDIYDIKNCHINRKFELDYETTIYPVLGEDKVVCEDNTVRLYPGKFEEYKWSNTLGNTATDSAWVVGDKAEYYVEVMDDRNCIGRDTVFVDTRDTDLIPEFLVASSVPVGDTLIIVEVSQPKPQMLDWHFSGKHQIVEQSTFYSKVIFEEEGNYEIVLNAHSYNCMAQARKTILVTPSVQRNTSEETSRKILSLMATPNPNNGAFNVKLKLDKARDATLYLVGIQDGKIVDKRKVNGLDTYNEFYNVNAPGIYAVFVEVDDERQVVKLLVQ